MNRDEYQQVTDDINRRSLEIAMRVDHTIADRLAELAASQPDAVFLLWDESEITYAQLQQRAAQVARVAWSQGLRRGDVAALMMENRPEFFYVWFGLLQIGAAVSLINVLARGAALVSALTAAGSKLCFVGTECLDQAREVFAQESLPPVVAVGGGREPAALPEGCEDFARLERAAREAPMPELVEMRSGLKCSDVACYMFTSGTTGLPKAAIITHAKWLSTGHRWIGMAGVKREDVFYSVLPLFHGAALMSLFSTVLAVGGKAALRERFSANLFWKDVARHRATVFQYVGEICRYLVNTPPVPEERDHTLRVALGAGMGADVWERFVSRFGSHVRIYEGWGSTESNCNMTNLDNRPGSCGRIPYWDKTFMRIVRFDFENERHVRGADGFLQLAAVDEPGEVIGQVSMADGTPVSPFDGYADASANAAKLLRNVFAEGDCWFRSGDILRCDSQGYCYFVDRIGDTFRWKSENVSTTEVAQRLSLYAAAESVNVYGVAVPGHEGRAGMAALSLRAGEDFDPAEFHRVASAELAPHAVPLFVRIVGEADITGTYKLRKIDLQRQGYDMEACGADLYVLDAQGGRYVKCSARELERLRLPPFARRAHS